MTSASDLSSNFICLDTLTGVQTLCLVSWPDKTEINGIHIGVDNHLISVSEKLVHTAMNRFSIILSVIIHAGFT